MGGQVVASTGPGAPKPPMAPPRPSRGPGRAGHPAQPGWGWECARAGVPAALHLVGQRAWRGRPRAARVGAGAPVGPAAGGRPRPRSGRARGAVSAPLRSPARTLGRTSRVRARARRAGSLPPPRRERGARRAVRASGPGGRHAAAAPVPRHDDGATDPLGALACALPGVLAGRPAGLRRGRAWRCCRSRGAR